MSETLISHTGELVDLTQAPAEVIGRIAQDIDARLDDLRSDKRALSDEITRRLDFEGRRSLEVDGWKFETTAPEERDIDVLGLQLVLTDLVGGTEVADHRSALPGPREPHDLHAPGRPLREGQAWLDRHWPTYASSATTRCSGPSAPSAS
jgi:hypothetical protein